MFCYRLTIQYKGAGYFGWQIQNGVNQRTIQGELNRALEKITKSKEIKSIGSGRTDAGVHAIGQVIKVDIPFEMDQLSLLRALNSLLPDAIRVLEAEKCAEDFHPVFHAKRKEYNYCFVCDSASPFSSELITSYPYELDFELISEACDILVGEHDFKDFYCVGTPVHTTVRKIFSCSVERVEAKGVMATGVSEYYLLKIIGNGFMKQMVRLIMGTLWNIGRGKVTLAELRDSLAGSGSGKLGAVAPPEGLYLKEVNY